MADPLTPATDPPAIVIADSSAYGRRLARAVLARSGFGRIHEAANGAEAVAMLGDLPVGLLLLDWDIDAIGAEEILALACPEGAATPPATLVTMGRPTRTRVARAVELGAATVLAKPYAPRLLGERAGRAMRRDDAA